MTAKKARERALKKKEINTLIRQTVTNIIHHVEVISDRGDSFLCYSLRTLYDNDYQKNRRMKILIYYGIMKTLEDDKLAGYSLYKKGSYAELSEYGFLRNTLTKDAKDKKDGYQFKIFETDEGAVLDLRTLLMQRMKTQQEMNDINEKLKQGKLSKKDAKDALAQLKTFEEQSKKILKEIDGFKERHSSEFDGMGIIGGQIVNLGFVQYGMRNDPIEIKGNDDDTYSAYFVPAQSSSDIKKFLETQNAKF